MLYESFGDSVWAFGSNFLTNDGFRHEFGDFSFFVIFDVFFAKSSTMGCASATIFWNTGPGRKDSSIYVVWINTS